MLFRSARLAKATGHDFVFVDAQHALYNPETIGHIAQAALGTAIDLETFDGNQSVKIPEGTQNGAKIKLKNLGVPKLNSSSRGDLYVHVAVHVPQKLTREQRKLFEQLREVLPAENQPEDKGLLDIVKDYFM